jgi:predicted peroxiredoxin
MAIGFGSNQLQRGHGLTIFFNDKGVKVASKANAAVYPEQQKLIRMLVEKGATVLVCPMCMKQYGVKESDLLPGLKVSSPESTGNAIFAEGAQTLSW